MNTEEGAPLAPGHPSVHAPSARIHACHKCSRPTHQFDILCPSCGSVLVEEPTKEQLERATRLAEFRSATKHCSIWQAVIRPLVPVIATLIVAIGGWIITSSYNQAQLRLESESHKSELEIQLAQHLANRRSSEANASMAYIQFLSRNPSPTDAERDLATLSMAPILAPELSFSLAVERCPSENRILGVLVRTYDSQSWEYLSPHVEDSTKAEPVFEFLQEQDLLGDFFDYLISSGNARPHRRLDALLAYFAFVTNGRTDLAFDRLVARICADESMDSPTKSDLTVALALSFPDHRAGNPDFRVYPLAARYFWSGTNILGGDLPSRHRRQLFANRFVSSEIVTVSARLQEELIADRLRKIPVPTIDRILYNYAMGTEGPRYLVPGDILNVMRSMLLSLDSADRMRRFSGTLGSMSGEILFRECLGDDQDIRRQYAEMLMSWYEEHAREDWYIPKFLHYVRQEFPEFEPRIERILMRV